MKTHSFYDINYSANIFPAVDTISLSIVHEKKKKENAFAANLKKVYFYLQFSPIWKPVTIIPNWMLKFI